MTRSNVEKSKYCTLYRSFPLAAWIILVHELLERFSFYGVKSLLTLYLTNSLGFSFAASTLIYHTFTAVAYLMPIFGAWLSDNYWGRYRTVVILGVLYLAGHIILSFTAVQQNPLGPMISIFLIAIGAGAVKPCVAAFGGDQIKANENDDEVLEKFFSLFYLVINVGGFFSQLLTPILRQGSNLNNRSSYLLGFGVQALIFLLTYLFFIVAKNTYKICPSQSNVLTRTVKCIFYAIKRWLLLRNDKTKKRENLIDFADDIYEISFLEDIKAVLRVIRVFIPFPIFWALFDQQGSRWTIQASMMTSYFSETFKLPPESMQSVNPLLIVIFVPLFNHIIYPILNRCNICIFPTNRIVVGYLFAGLAFIYTGALQVSIESRLPSSIKSGSTQLRILNFSPCRLNEIYFSDELLKNSVYSFEKVESQIRNTRFPQSDTVQNFINCPNFNETKNISFLFSNESYSLIFYGDEDAVQMFISKEKNSRQLTRSRARFGFLQQPVKYVNESFLLINSKKTINFNLKNDSFSEDWMFTDYQLIDSLGDWKLDLVYMNANNSLQNYKTSFNFSEKYITSETIYCMKDKANIVKCIRSPEQIITPMFVLWQLPAYVLMCVGEILFSITAMTYSYNQAPEGMKAILQASYLLTIFFGNILAALPIHLPPAYTFFLYAALMPLAALLQYVLFKHQRINMIKHQRRDTVVIDIEMEM